LGGRPIGEFFVALGPDWQLTGIRRARLAPAVTAPLALGWTPQVLAAFTGVRNPYAVLAARLSPTELPPQETEPRPWPAWCGECDERTRMLGFDGDAPVLAVQASISH
jgi:hypothetical protein